MSVEARAAPASGRALAEAAYERLTGMILSGELRPGDPLQESRLAEQLGISRTPLREAIGRLEGEAMIVRLGGRGTFVRSISVDEYMQTLHLRKVLERETTALAVGRLDKARISVLRHRIERLLETGVRPDGEYRAVDQDLHGMIVEASGNEIIAQILGDQRRKTMMFNIKRLPDRFRPSCEEHIQILDCLLADDRDAAVAAMENHLDAVRDCIIRALAPAYSS